MAVISVCLVSCSFSCGFVGCCVSKRSLYLSLILTSGLHVRKNMCICSFPAYVCGCLTDVKGLVCALKLWTDVAALTPITEMAPPLSLQPTSQSLPSCLFILTASPCDCSQPTGCLQWGMTSLTSLFPPAAGELHFLLRVFVLKWRLAPRLSLGCPLLPCLLLQLTDVGMY